MWGVCAAVLLVLAARFLDHSSDDAFISFRYAENWAEGLGPVFNPGERVEGYSNFLWVAVLALFARLDVAPLHAATLLGVASAVLLPALAMRHAPPTRRPWLQAAAPLWVAVSPPVAVWASAGLETPLFALLVAALLLESARDRQRETLGARCAVLAALVVLARPEGIGVALLVAGLWWTAGRSDGERADSGPLLRYGTVVGAVFVPYFAWRLVYYGAWLPNTFHVKVGASGSQIVRGLDYLHGYLWPAGYLLLGLAVVGAFRGTPRRSCRMLGGFVLAWSAYVIAIGGDGLVMFRFVVPIVVPLAILATAGLDRLVPGWVPRRTAHPALIAAIMGIAAFTSLDAFRGLALEGVRQEVREVEAWRAIGQWMQRHASPDATVAVLPAGAIPYYSELAAIDLLGLTDRHIARRDTALGRGQAGHEKHDADYVLARRPDYIVVGNYGLISPEAPRRYLIQPFYEAEERLVAHPEFHRRYRLHEVELPAGRFAIAKRLDSSS